MARRKFILTPASREALVLRADDLAAALADNHMTGSEASSLVIDIVVDALTLAGDVAGSQVAAEAAGFVAVFGKVIVEKIAEATRPDLERLQEKAQAAIKDGNFKRARRLLDKIDRVAARRGDPVP